MNVPPSSSPVSSSSATPPAGLLVITVDRLPAWILAAYGATWVATPALDSLAARGIVVDRVITPSLDFHATLRELACVAEGRSQLAAAAAAAGWRTTLVTDDPAVAQRMATDAVLGLDVGLRLVEAVAETDVAADDTATNIARLMTAAVAVIGSGAHQLVWIHIGSLGVGWDAPERHRDRYIDPDDPPPPTGASVPGFAVDADTDPDLVVGMRQVFAGQLTLLDSQLARVLQAVRGWSVCFAGVRGLPLGLHGWMGVGGRDIPFGELVHVPAILVDAGERMAAQRYGGLVVPADLGCTLVDLLAGPGQGQSLAGLFVDWSACSRDQVIVTGPDGAAVVTPEWHLLVSEPQTSSSEPQIRLYAKPDDFFELADVANRCSDQAEQLIGLLTKPPG